ncbi:MAG: hypothetical protein WDO16_06765 [Bacteroidota bacterium]
MKRHWTGIVNKMNKEGDKNVTSYFFSKQFNKGCDWHPDLEEHKEIAGELTAFIRKKMNW